MIASSDCQLETFPTFRAGSDLENRVRNRVLAALRAAGYPALWSVQCRVDGGVVALHGVLPSYFLKQIAQHVALAMNDQWVIKNLIEVSS